MRSPGFARESLPYVLLGGEILLVVVDVDLHVLLVAQIFQSLEVGRQVLVVDLKLAGDELYVGFVYVGVDFGCKLGYAGVHIGIEEQDVGIYVYQIGQYVLINLILVGGGIYIAGALAEQVNVQAQIAADDALHTLVLIVAEGGIGAVLNFRAGIHILAVHNGGGVAALKAAQPFSFLSRGAPMAHQVVVIVIQPVNPGAQTLDLALVAGCADVEGLAVDCVIRTGNLGSVVPVAGQRDGCNPLVRIDGVGGVLVETGQILGLLLCSLVAGILIVNTSAEK